LPSAVCLSSRWTSRSKLEESSVRYFRGYSFPCFRLSPLEVLRQTSSRAAGQASVRSFRFRQTQPSHSNRPLVCIGISARVQLTAILAFLAPENKGAAISMLTLGAGASALLGPAIVALFIGPLGFEGVMWIR